MFYYYFLISLVAVIMQFFNWWYISKGHLKVSYYLSIFVYSMVAIVDTSVALANPDQVGILLFDLVNFWAIIMSIKGAVRLRRERGSTSDERVGN